MVFPCVLLTTRGRTYPTMGGRRTHIFDGDWKDSYLESHCFPKIWADCHSTDLYSMQPRGIQMSGNQIFRTQGCASRDIGWRVFGLHRTSKYRNRSPRFRSQDLIPISPHGVCYACKKLAKLANTFRGNVQLGKNVATTHHQGGDRTVGPARKGI